MARNPLRSLDWPGSSTGASSRRLSRPCRGAKATGSRSWRARSDPESCASPPPCWASIRPRPADGRPNCWALTARAEKCPLAGRGDRPQSRRPQTLAPVICSTPKPLGPGACWPHEIGRASASTTCEQAGEGGVAPAPTGQLTRQSNFSHHRSVPQTPLPVRSAKTRRPPFRLKSSGCWMNPCQGAGAMVRFSLWFEHASDPCPKRRSLPPWSSPCCCPCPAMSGERHVETGRNPLPEFAERYGGPPSS